MEENVLEADLHFTLQQLDPVGSFYALSHDMIQLVSICFEDLTFSRDITPSCMKSSAVGFGNVWRFPSLAYDYGGGAFFIPYLFALFVVGIPMLFLEILLGQVYQRGDISVFAVCHKRMRGVGVASVACGFMVRFLISSFLLIH